MIFLISDKVYGDLCKLVCLHGKRGNKTCECVCEDKWTGIHCDQKTDPRGYEYLTVHLNMVLISVIVTIILLAVIIPVVWVILKRSDAQKLFLEKKRQDRMKRILANVLENNYENPDFENDIKRTETEVEEAEDYRK